jgi:3-dehydroquinate synthase
MTNSTITVKASQGAYSVNFCEDAVEVLRSIATDSDCICLDRNIAEIYPQFAGVLPAQTFIVDSGESAKSYEGVIPLLHHLINTGFRRDGRLFAVGGGITQDAVSFVASLLYRGVSWIFVPTSLLAQCDSCIGSKTSINFKQYKNQLGGFYPPTEVYVDTSLTKTLGPAEMASGLGEMLHYFVVTSESDFALFLNSAPRVRETGEDLEVLVRRSLEIKRRMVELDEFDRGPRNVFNYGHSFGHALESSCGYLLPHGIAVAYGIDLANLVAVHLGLLDGLVRNRIRAGCQIVFDGFPCPDLDMDGYYEALKRDKKNSGGQLGLILLSSLGSAAKTMVDFSDDIRVLIRNFFGQKMYLRDI